MSEGEQRSWDDEDAAFKHFDKDQDGFLNKNEFSALCSALFQNEKEETYQIDADMIDAIFTIFDTNKVVPPINQLLDENQFDVVVFTLDWHPENHVSFIDNIHQRPLHKSCKVPEDAVFVYKGTDPDIDSYSAFWDNIKKSQSSLNEELQKRNVTDLFLCGIGYDVCVAATTRHAIEEGYRAMLVDNATRGVCDLDIQATKDHTIANNGLIVHISQVKGLATERDRPPVLAYKLAQELSKKMNNK